MRRVVVTGMGAVSPLGNDLATTWDGLVAGKSGIDFIKGFDASDYPAKVGAEVKDFDPTGLAPPKELRKLARYTQYSLAAAKEAVESAGLIGAYPSERIGVVFGSAVGDIGTIASRSKYCSSAAPVAWRPGSSPASSPTRPAASWRSPSVSAESISPWSPPALPVPTRSARAPRSFAAARPTRFWPAAPRPL